MSDMENAIKDLAEIMQFEFWLRFYFIKEEDGKLFIRIPEQAQKKLREEYPAYWGLVEIYMDAELTIEFTQAAFSTFVVQTLEGTKYRSGLVAEAFDSKGFKEESQLFGIWSQHHESQLEQIFYGVQYLAGTVLGMEGVP